MESSLRFCTECGLENPALDSRSEATVVVPEPWADTPTVFPAVERQPQPAKRNPMMIAGLIAGAFGLLILGGIAGRQLFRDAPANNTVNPTSASQPANEKTPATGLPTITPQRRPVVSPTNQPTVDDFALKREVEDTLNGWAGATRDHDFDRHMSYYSDRLDTYFLRRDVSVNTVRANRGPAFARYHTLDVQLRNISVTIDPSGTTATAVFDKTYRFDGDKILSGSVQQMVWLTKVTGRWLITGERDLRVYHTNK